jgi:iron complex transport system substrate-binding protein
VLTVKKRMTLLLLVLLLALSVGLVQAAPQRIVSLAPSVTENLFALGVGDRVVGVTSWCDYPEEATTKTIIGDAMSLNLEVLLSLEPDLVVGDANLVAGYLETLAEFGIPVFVVAPTTLQEVQESLISIGEAVGAEIEGWALATAMENRLNGLLARINRTETVRVFVEIWNEPLMSAGPGSFIDELIVLAGGENIAGDADNPWPVFSEEVVIDRDPEVVILTGFNLEEVLGRSAWQSTTALKQGAVYEVDPNLYSRTTPRLLDALEEMIGILDAVAQ